MNSHCRFEKCSLLGSTRRCSCTRYEACSHTQSNIRSLTLQTSLRCMLRHHRRMWGNYRHMSHSLRRSRFHTHSRNRYLLRNHILPNSIRHHRSSPRVGLHSARYNRQRCLRAQSWNRLAQLGTPWDIDPSQNLPGRKSRPDPKDHFRITRKGW